jgi:hypothetical protein
MTFFYKHLPQVNRVVAAGPTEFVHSTVAQRVAAGSYQDSAFMKKHAAQFAVPNSLEVQLAGYAPETIMPRRKAFLRETMTFCDRLVRIFLGY